MALHISQGRDFPLFMYGQAALGALEAYIGAGLFLLFGPSILILRIGLLCLFVIFLILLYNLTKRLYTKGLALFTLFLLSLATIENISRSVLATLGHAETPLFCAIIVLLSIHLALHSITPYREKTPAQRLKCLGLYVLWGVMTGLAVWNDALAGSFILASGVFMLFYCRKTLRPTTVAGGVLGLCVGLLPLVMHDLLFSQGQGMLSEGQHSLSVLTFLSNSSQNVSIFQRWKEGFMVALPTSTGASGVCYIQPMDAWPVTAQSSSYVRQCTTAHSIWAVIFAAIWIIAVILEIRSLYQIRKSASSQPADAHTKMARQMIVHGGRLLLLGGAGLAWFVFSSSAQVRDAGWSTRYLISMTLTTPAMLWPLWSQITSVLEERQHLLRKKGLQILCGILLLTFIAIEIKGTTNAFSQFPGGMPVVGEQITLNDAQQVDLTNNLVRQHVSHLYTEYWTCNLLIFYSHEQVLCSSVGFDLHPYNNRYSPYVSLVEQDPQAAYLFPKGSPQIATVKARLAREKRKYQVSSFDGYELYAFPTR